MWDVAEPYRRHKENQKTGGKRTTVLLNLLKIWFYFFARVKGGLEKEGASAIKIVSHEKTAQKECKCVSVGTR